MRHRLFALCLSLGMVLSLCACGGGQTGPDPAPVPPSPAPSAEAASPAPEATATPEAPEAPTKAPNSEAPASEAPTLCEYPTAPAPSDTPSTPAPSPTPAPEATPAPQAVTAAGLREQFMSSSSQSDAPTAGFVDMADHLSDFYDLDAAALEDFVLYMPDMSAALQEFFLARAKAGKAEEVKAACQSRLDGLREDAAFYPGTAQYVDAAKVETAGDWVLLAVCPEAERMVKLLQDSVK